MIKLLTVADYKRYEEGMNKTLAKINEDLGLPLHMYHCDNAFVFENAQITKDDLVLDIGCGEGSSSVQAAHFAKEVIAIDREPHFLQFEEYEKKGVTNIWHSVQDATDLEVDTESIDKVISISALEHNSQENRKKIIRECIRVLKPGGTITMSAGVGIGYITSELEIFELIYQLELLLASFVNLTGWYVPDTAHDVPDWCIGESIEKTYREWMDFLGYDQGWIPCGFKAIKQ